MKSIVLLLLMTTLSALADGASEQNAVLYSIVDAACTAGAKANPRSSVEKVNKDLDHCKSLGHPFADQLLNPDLIMFEKNKAGLIVGICSLFGDQNNYVDQMKCLLVGVNEKAKTRTIKDLLASGDLEFATSINYILAKNLDDTTEKFKNRKWYTPPSHISYSANKNSVEDLRKLLLDYTRQ